MPDSEAIEVVSEVVGGSIDVRSGAKGFRDPAEAYLAGLRRPQSRRAATESLRLLARTLGFGDGRDNWRAVPWVKLQAAETTAVRSMLLQLDYAPGTVRLALAVLRGVLKTAFRFGLVGSEQYLRATDLGRIPRQARRPRRKLTEAEVVQLHRHCTTLPPEAAAYHRALLGVALGGGLRRAEIGDLRVDALGPDQRLRFMGKGGKLAEQPLVGWALETVQAWIAVRARAGVAGEALFPRLLRHADGRWQLDPAGEPMSVWQVWATIRGLQEAAGVAPFTPHDLRRTFATLQIKMAGLGMARLLMRHADGSTTMTYDQSTDEEAAAALERNIDALGPATSASSERSRVVRATLVPGGKAGLVTVSSIVTAADGAEEQLADLVARGEATLKKIDVDAVLGRGWIARSPLLRADGRSTEHTALCGAAWLLIARGGVEPSVKGIGLDFPGGRADVAAVGAVYALCGRVRADRVLAGVRGGATLLVLPYPEGRAVAAFLFAPAPAVSAALVKRPRK